MDRSCKTCKHSCKNNETGKRCELPCYINYYQPIEEKTCKTELFTACDPVSKDGDYSATTTGYKCGKCDTFNIIDVRIDKPIEEKKRNEERNEFCRSYYLYERDW